MTLGPEKTGTTRRDALKIVAGASVAAITVTGTTRLGLAQDATPVASPVAGGLEGQYMVVRVRVLAEGRSGEELTGLIRDGFVPLLREVPGFVSYLAVADDETRDQLSVGVYADRDGAEESTNIAVTWGSESGAVEYTQGDPTVHEGVIGVAAEADDASSIATPAPTDAATPVAGGGYEGKYLAVRLREPNPEQEPGEAARLIAEGYVPLVRAIPGFAAYFGSENADSGQLAYVVIFDDKAGADESTRVAGQWLADNGYEFFTGEPIVAEGVIGVAAEA